MARNNSSYSCYYYALIDDKLMQNTNKACWAGLMNPSYTYFNGETKSNGASDTIRLKRPDFIYIKDFRLKSRQYEQIFRLVNLINNITPCKIVAKGGGEYIKYKLIKDGEYSNNLVLLNLIRMCWYNPGGFNIDKFFNDIMKPSRGIDSLKFLLTCVKNNVRKLNVYETYLDHSLITPELVVKSTKHLMEYKGTYMETFLKKTLKK